MESSDKIRSNFRTRFKLSRKNYDIKIYNSNLDTVMDKTFKDFKKLED